MTPATYQGILYPNLVLVLSESMPIIGVAIPSANYPLSITSLYLFFYNIFLSIPCIVGVIIFINRDDFS